MDAIVVVGAANDGELVVDLIEDINRTKPAFEILGFLDDDPSKQGRTINGYPVLGRLADHHRLAPGAKFVLAVASAKRTYRTRQIARALGLGPGRLATLVHPQATISRSATLGPGCFVMAGVRINSRVRLGECVIVEGNAWLGVGTTVGDYAVVTHDASVSGDCVLEEGSYIGANCSIIGRTRIGAWAVVGMGAVVLQDVPPRTVVVGNPARPVGGVEIGPCPERRR
jgi:sugar O-acyltransferase (sialic acid O-acetyltransferase NeuD family)